MVRDTDLFVVAIWLIVIWGVIFIVTKTAERLGETYCKPQIVIVNGKEETREVRK